MGCALSRREPEPTPPPAAAMRKRASVSAQGGIDPSKVMVNLATLPKVAKSDEAVKRIWACVAKNVLCSALTQEYKEALVSAMKEVKVAAGEYVIQQGQLGDFWYIVDSGAFEVFKKTEATDTSDGAKVNAYTVGDSFGELALMYNQRRAASVKATVDSVAFAVDQATFRALMCVRLRLTVLGITLLGDKVLTMRTC